MTSSCILSMARRPSELNLAAVPAELGGRALHDRHDPRLWSGGQVELVREAAHELRPELHRALGRQAAPWANAGGFTRGGAPPTCDAEGRGPARHEARDKDRDGCQDDLPGFAMIQEPRFTTSATGSSATATAVSSSNAPVMAE